MRSADDADELRGRLEDGVVAELGGAVGGGLAPDSSGSAMLPGVDCWTLLLCCSAIWCGAALPRSAAAGAATVLEYTYGSIYIYTSRAAAPDIH